MHHKIPLTPVNIKDQDISLSWDNLMLLCHDCHNRAHHSSTSKVKRYIFNKDGGLRPLPPMSAEI
ncbi:MAG: HNH endonuclease [Defluviitaleaceae bacterium]|nr:HNH endonuclease [Defluviitaleaceae bacterium]